MLLFTHQQDCPTEYVSEWLNSVVDKVPTIHRCAKYWLCRITIAQQEEKNANEIINIYERAVEEEAQVNPFLFHELCLFNQQSEMPQYSVLIDFDGFGNAKANQTPWSIVRISAYTNWCKGKTEINILYP